MKTTDAVGVVRQWAAKGRPYYWRDGLNAGVEDLCLDLEEFGETVEYDEAALAMRGYETTKMPGSADAGMQWIRDQWKVLRRAEKTNGME